LHEVFTTLLQVPDPLQYWVVKVPVVALQVVAVQTVEVEG
jgi:hypothetical protein